MTLLAAFLTHNREREILAALSLLHHSRADALRRLGQSLTADFEPGSLHICRRMSVSDGAYLVVISGCRFDSDTIGAEMGAA